MNEVTVVGNVVSNPIYRVSQDQQTRIARFTITLTDDTGQSVAPPVLQQVVAFGRLADNVNESLQQGLEAVVVGKLTADTYESEDGDRPQQLVLVAQVVAPSLRFAPAAVKWEAQRPGARQRHHMTPEVYDGE
jgi:single-stranded DNA-binding protein